MTEFSYAEMITRNAGFISSAEQERLRNGGVFVCGVGGMGGSALQSLVRAGVGRVAIADMDDFEISNLNRQVFATVESVGRSKVEATVQALRDINPTLSITTFGAEWVDHLDTILPAFPVVINGMDDVTAGIVLYRKARAHRATVIDAYTSPLPSVTVVRPDDPRPEERLHFPSVGREYQNLSAADVDACKLAEIVYVMVHSSSANHIDLTVAGELMAGKRSRPSFAPMVITTGNLMAFEAVKLLLGRPSGVDHRGVFLNPWAMRIERPRGALVASARSLVARRFLAKLIARD